MRLRSSQEAPESPVWLLRPASIGRQRASPLPGHTWAHCRHGTLFVEEQLEEPFATYTLAPGKNYHGLDSPLFYMDIRENAKARVRAYLESNPR